MNDMIAKQVDPAALEAWLTEFRSRVEYTLNECNLLDVIADRERQLAEAQRELNIYRELTRAGLELEMARAALTDLATAPASGQAVGDKPDLSTLLAECEKASFVLGPLEVRTIRTVTDDAESFLMPLCLYLPDEVPDGSVEAIVTLVNAYPYLRDEIVRLHNLIDEAGKPWLALDPGVPWEGAIDAAMAAACREITRLRSLIARTVVVMDGSWDTLPPHEQDRLAEELRDAALTDAPAPKGDHDE